MPADRFISSEEPDAAGATDGDISNDGVLSVPLGGLLSLRRPEGGTAAAFARSYRRRKCSRSGELDLEGDDESTDDDNSVPGKVAAVSEGEGDGCDRRRDSAPSMNQCVTMLEPHLAAFRDICESAGAADTSIAVEGDGGIESRSGGERAKDEVPAPLLRLARFFGWKWAPIKRALLRPPAAVDGEGGLTAMQVEVGSAYRLRLARALHARGLLAVAEVDDLAAACSRWSRERENVSHSMSPEDADGPQSGRPKKRQRGDDERLHDRIKLALSRLPSDALVPGAAERAVRLAKKVLVEYCSWWREHNQAENTEESAAGDGPRNNLFAVTPDQIASEALTAFVGLVLSTGIDSRGGSTVESMFAAMIMQIGNGDATSKMAVVVEATKIKVKELMSPSLIDDLSSLHLLALARLLSYLDAEVACDYFSESIFHCTKHGGGAGLASLPKLIATYLSLLSQSQLQSKVSLPEFESRLRGKIAKGDSCSDSVRVESRSSGGVKCQKSTAAPRQAEFVDAIFHASSYLLLHGAKG